MTDTQQQQQYNATSVVDIVKNLVGLYMRDARLNLAEKLSMLLSAVAVFGIAFLLLMAVLIFIGILLADVLSKAMAPYWAYLIVVGIYLALLVILVLTRKCLIIDPIARFVSRLLLNPPSSDKQ